MTVGPSVVLCRRRSALVSAWVWVSDWVMTAVGADNREHGGRRGFVVGQRLDLHR